MIQLLDLAVRAHGGLDAWRSIKSIELKASLNGELLRIKGHPEGIIDVLIHIEAREPALTITPFGRPDFAGHFLPDRVWLEGNGSGKEQVLRNPRRSFEEHSIASGLADLVGRPGTDKEVVGLDACKKYLKEAVAKVWERI